MIPAHPDLPTPDHPDARADFADPAFGEVALYPVRGKVPTRSYLVRGDEVYPLPAKPASLRSIVLGLVTADELRTRMLRDAVPDRVMFVWAPPAHLALTRIGPTMESDDEVVAALRAIAAALVAEVNPDAALGAIAEGLALPASGPVIRRLERYENYVSDDEPSYGRLAALGARDHVGPTDVAEHLGLTEVKLEEHPAPLSGVLQLHPGSFGALGQRHHYSSEYGEETLLVRPAWRASSALVEAAAVRAGIPAAEEDPSAAATGAIYLDADDVTALPALGALLAPNLRIVGHRDAGGEATVLATLPHGLFAPVDPVRDDREGGWAPHLRAKLRAARAAVIDEWGHHPLAVLPVAKVDALGFVGTSPQALRYVLELEGDQSPLPWRQAAALKPLPHQTDRWELDVDAYRRELLGALVEELGLIDDEDPVEAVSTRLIRLAHDLKMLVNPALAEAEALGCPPDLLAAVVGPLEVARGMLASATPARLRPSLRTGSVALAGLVAAALAHPPAPAAPPLPPAHPAPAGEDETDTVDAEPAEAQ